MLKSFSTRFCHNIEKGIILNNGIEHKSAVRKVLFYQMGQAWPLFVYFCPFLNTLTNIVQYLTINGRSIDGVLGIRTRDYRMVSAADSAELWRHPSWYNFTIKKVIWLKIPIASKSRFIALIDWSRSRFISRRKWVWKLKNLSTTFYCKKCDSRNWTWSR